MDFAGMDRHDMKDYLVNLITTTNATHTHVVAICKETILNPSWTPIYTSELKRILNHLHGSEQRDSLYALSTLRSKDTSDVFRWVMNTVRECAQAELDYVAENVPNTNVTATEFRQQQREAEDFYKEYQRKSLLEQLARNPPDLTPPIVEETKPMKPFNKVAYNEIFEQRADSLSVDQLIGYITKVNDQIVALEKVPAESKKVATMIAQLKQDKADIVAELDSRD